MSAGFLVAACGYVTSMMRRERIEKKPAKRRRPLADVLPLDPRDPDILRAKELVERQQPPRRRAA